MYARRVPDHLDAGLRRPTDVRVGAIVAVMLVTSSCYRAHTIQPTTDVVSDAATIDVGVVDALAPRDVMPDDAYVPHGCELTTGPTTAMPCSTRLRLVSMTLQPNPRCFVDTRVTVPADAVLRYDCGGGAAEIVYANGTRFVGGFRAGVVEVCMATTYDDGCHWQTSQRISGSLSTSHLSFEYSEVYSGSNCGLACTASGDLTVE